MEKYYSYKEQIEIDHFLLENCSGKLRSDVSLNEDAQIDVTANAVDKMLDFTLAKYGKIDFMEIEKSRGDVTACRFYKNLKESIDIVCDIDATTHEIPGAHVVSTALNNLLTLKNKFVDAFRRKNKLVIMLYNSIYYSIVEATSYIIASSIDYAVEGKKIHAGAYKVNSRDMLLISSLEKFNTAVADDTISKFIEETNKLSGIDENTVVESVMTENVSVSAVEIIQKLASKFGPKIAAHKTLLITVGIIAGVIFLLVKIVPLLQNCVYAIYKTRHKISESAKMQAELIELNKDIYSSTGNADETVLEKQQKSIDNFKKISNAFALDVEKSNRDAKQELNRDQIDVNMIVL